jgi:Double zinc ribbon
MLIIYGNKWYFDSKGLVDHPCPQCGKKPCELCWGRNKATAYWIPTFTVNQSHVLKCFSCNEHYLIDKVTGDRLLGEVQGSMATKPAPVPTVSAPAQPAAPTPSQASPPPGQAERIGQDMAAKLSDVTCTKCGSLPAAGARFCHVCGAPMPQPRACPACGRTQTSGKFCSHCGGQLSDNVKEAKLNDKQAAG